jgi:DNA-binding transcriptional MerR regulator
MLTPGEVSRLFHVDPRTVNRWARTVDPETGEPLLPSIRTPGGHRRYPRAAVEAILAGERSAQRSAHRESA